MTIVDVPMDEIVIMGFSRGSYTARCIASLISDVGLLTRVGMEVSWKLSSTVSLS